MPRMGRVFPYVFPVPATWWSQNTAKIRFIGQQVGGANRLSSRGRRSPDVYYDNELRPGGHPLARHPGGRVPVFTVQHLAVHTAGARPEGDVAASQGRPTRPGPPAHFRPYDLRRP